MSTRTGSYCILAVIAALAVTAGFPQPIFCNGLTVFNNTYIRETQNPQVLTDRFLCSDPTAVFTLMAHNVKNGAAGLISPAGLLVA